MAVIQSSSERAGAAVGAVRDRLEALDRARPVDVLGPQAESLLADVDAHRLDVDDVVAMGEGVVALLTLRGRTGPEGWVERRVSFVFHGPGDAEPELHRSWVDGLAATSRI